MKQLIILIPFLCWGSSGYAETVTINLTQVPSNHPFSDSIYLAGSFNGWNPRDVKYAMTLNPDNTHSLVLNGSGTIQYKFTRGSWTKVEKGSSCEELSNRTFTFGSSTTENAQVVNWADLCGTGTQTHTAQSNVTIMNTSFSMPQLNRNRRIWIYLPADYSTTTKKYPVLYMHDAQNLFDNYYSFAGEWGIDETLNSLFNAGDYGCIVVGVDNGGVERINEYSPWVNASYGGGDGDKYARFIVETLKPYIDQNYRTSPEREKTGIMGSSMGGLISFYIGLKYQEVFSKIGIFSPSFWFSKECYSFGAKTKKMYPLNIYFLAGGQEAGVIQDCKNMMDTLSTAGFTTNELTLKSVSNGQHSEWFWKQEFPFAYKTLFTTPTYLNLIPEGEIKVYQNSVLKELNIRIGLQYIGDTYSIFDMKGILIQTAKLQKKLTVIPLNKSMQGTYLITVGNFQKKFTI